MPSDMTPEAATRALLRDLLTRDEHLDIIALIEQLTAENQRLRDALGHYGDEYKWSTTGWKHTPSKNVFACIGHGYELAQRALKGSDEDGIRRLC